MTEKQKYSRVAQISACVNRFLKKTCDDLEITEKITWSSARSSFISKMIDEGYHPLQVAEFSGNCPRTIYKYYYTNTDKENVRNHMNDIL